ncbi:hypothetical protein HNQ02_003873, partial [Flavobacterium sp. 7E]|nr:hypothetical protein [Flavobacterium sp. 7E]NRS90918.1 hypothetical protein [Flavobacterium sp. 7E]NRT17183.1 hypothetical protein [Flavobacterium sp. 28A]NRT17188.1 hypothetical protein [Flavobacterium sp. 28A]
VILKLSVLSKKNTKFDLLKITNDVAIDP